MHSTNKRSGRLLLVEDDPGLGMLLSGMLVEQGYSCDVICTGQKALECFAGSRWDLVLLDYALPDLAANQIITAAGSSMPPFIVLTGNGDERVAVELMKMGARDYLIKDGSLLELLPASIARALKEISVERQLQIAEAALKQSESELEAILEHAPVMMVLLDEQGSVRRLNQAARDFFGESNTCEGTLKLGQLLGCSNSFADHGGCGTLPHCPCDIKQKLLETVQNGTNQRRFEIGSRGGFNGPLQTHSVLVSMSRVTVSENSVVLLCLEDVTEQKRLEAQCRQSQKMEAIGQLAGGVAHDFNNILTGFLMHLGLLRCDPKLSPSMSDSLMELETQAQRAANLTRQLLLFGRRQMMQTKPLQLNDTVENMLKMLGRILGEQIVIEFEPNRNLPLIKADPGMIEQVIMNLCVNARDAMPRGGVLRIIAEEVEVRADAILKNHDARTGRFVRLSVSDNGCGMDEQTAARIFEPFFTTKEVGKGTGLGLATVFGIIKQHDGWVEVESCPNLGSTFSVYVPARPELDLKPRPNASVVAAGGDETILVVEDDAQVRRLTAAVLKRKGYTVLEANNGPAAIELWNQSIDRIDLLFSDMVMPAGLTGLDLARKMRSEKPSIGVILFSGYSPDLAAARAAGEKGLMYLPKPCSQELLARTVRQCLDTQRKAKLTEIPQPA